MAIRCVVLASRGGNETARVHHASRRRGGCVAACRTRAAGRASAAHQRVDYAESDSEGQAQIAAFRAELQKLGWTDGRNIRIDTRWVTPGDAELMQRFAKELVAL